VFGRTSRPEPDAIEVLIGARATFSGTLQCDASIRIDGAVDQGHSTTPANVILTETATVQCDIIARVVSIRGKFKGIIQADRVELLDGSQVGGVLNVNSFYMDDNVLMRAAVNIRADTMAEVSAAAPPPANPPIPVTLIGDAPSPAPPTFAAARKLSIPFCRAGCGRQLET
jgi:cytoskeletal protein CcmA (bactofilin family)